MRIRSVIVAAIVLYGSLLSATAVRAAAPGDLVKLADDKAVYFCGYDGKRYVFPNAQTYSTWYADFSLVKVVSPAELAALPIGGNVTYRPGTRLVKITSDPDVYAVEPGGSLRWIQNEAVAKSLYGDLWNERIDDVPDTLFLNYKTAEPLAAPVYPSGTFVKRSSDGAYFRIENRAKRKVVSADVRTALRLRDAFVITASDDLSGYPDGADIATAEPAITDAAQKNLTPGPAVPTFTVRTPPTSFIGVGLDATLIELHMASATAFTVKKITVTIAATTNNPADPALDDDLGGLVYRTNPVPNLAFIRILDESGSEVFGRNELSLDIARDQSQTLVFTGTFNVPAGAERTLYLKTRLNSFLPAGEGYAVTLPVSGLEVVDSASGSITPFQPQADIRGPSLSTSSGSMEVAVSNTPGNKTHVRGAKDAVISGLSFRATAFAANVINSVAFQGYIDSENTAGFQAGHDVDLGSVNFVRDIIPQISLYTSTGTKIAGPESVDAYGRMTFSGLAYVIPAGQTVILVLRGDISSTVDLGQQPDKITFDIVDASKDVIAAGENGGKVSVIGTMPGGAMTGGYHSTIRKSGTVGYSWAGASGVIIAGREVLLGTLIGDVKIDGFILKVISFRAIGAHTSLGDLRLEYPATGSGTASATGKFSGDIATFTGLDIALPVGQKTYINLYGKINYREGGAVYGQQIKVKFDTGNALNFASRSSGEVYDETALYGDFTVTRNSESSALIRFGRLNIVLSADSPGGTLYRDNTAELLRFFVKTEAEGGARIKKMTFKVAPADAGIAGADNDSLERWAKVNGDFIDDDGVVDLYQISGNVRTRIGEGSSARIMYSVVHGGVKDSSPSDIVSGKGDYGLIEYVFNDGAELAFGPNASQLFSFGIDTMLLNADSDHAVSVALLGDGDFQWTDIISGAYDAMNGADATGLPLSKTMTVKK